MVSSSSDDFPQKCVQIKKDDKFFSRIVSKEGSSMANNNNNNNHPSFRIYYGGVSGAVPFMWESQPGTPKHTLFSNTSLPPLTPPPSYQFMNSNKNPNKLKHSRSTLLRTLFPRLNNSTNNKQQQSHVSPSPPSSLSLSSSWSSSSTTSSMFVKKKRGRFSSSASGSSFDSMMDEYEEEEPESSRHHTSTLCFGFAFGRETNINGGGGGVLREGCSSYSAMSMKKAFLSIVGQGSKVRY